MNDANQSTAAGGTVSETGDADQSGVTIADVETLAERVIENVETVIVGKHETVEHTLVAVLARGHILLQDVPGTGKTMLARALARSFDGSFKRVQFTPDLLPSDITGINVYNQQTSEFEFQAGPVFANVVLGDEINRAPPKTQSALLEAMEEEQVTVDGETRAVPNPFTVIATQNTVEPNRTYELPIAEVDRFMKQLELGYPGSHEAEMLGRVVEKHPITGVEPVASVEELNEARARVGAVTVKEPVREYAADLANFTRNNARLGVSPRGTIALVRAGQARAAITGREYVIPDDLQQEAPSVLAHRIHLDADHDGTGRGELIGKALDSVPIP